MIIENQYIQTSLMVVLTLFRGKDWGGGPIDKSKVNIMLRKVVGGRDLLNLAFPVLLYGEI